MIRILLLIAACVLMGKIADAERMSPIIWGCITFVYCLVCEAFMPFLGTLIGATLSFATMALVKSFR